MSVPRVYSPNLNGGPLGVKRAGLRSPYSDGTLVPDALHRDFNCSGQIAPPRRAHEIPWPDLHMRIVEERLKGYSTNSNFGGQVTESIELGKVK